MIILMKPNIYIYIMWYLQIYIYIYHSPLNSKIWGSLLEKWECIGLDGWHADEGQQGAAADGRLDRWHADGSWGLAECIRRVVSGAAGGSAGRVAWACGLRGGWLERGSELDRLPALASGPAAPWVGARVFIANREGPGNPL